jgi:hypothetical protein
MDFLTYLAKEGAAIWQAPLTFLTAAVLAGLLGYGIARLIFMSRLDTAADRLKLKDEQIADRDRKLDELRQVTESPPPKVEAHGDGEDDYSDVIRKLVSRYIFETENVNPEILAGRELPSVSWMNHQLLMMDKDWRITDVRGPIAEIGPARS